METVGKPPADTELQFLTDWSEPDASPRRRAAVVGTLLVHAALVGGLAIAPPGFLTPPPGVAEAFRVTLVEPLFELTQKAPTKGKLNKEFEAPDVQPRPRIQIPAGMPSTTRPEAPRPAAIPTPPVPAPATPLPEPPKVEASAPNVPKPPQAPPPQIQPEETPKLAFETPPAPVTVPPGKSRVPVPNSSVSNAIAQTLRGGGGAGTTVGDTGSGPGGYGEGINLPPSPGSSGSSLQLLSDPLGVDFRPYLIRILASVKQHWLAVLPESVRLGRRGRVAIQFSVSRDGNVPKLVIAESSGADPLDRAAVAGISASVPFPPLPTEFKGTIIKLQFNFAYNLPKQ